jgi:hypothetical protein
MFSTKLNGKFYAIGAAIAAFGVAAAALPNGAAAHNVAAEIDKVQHATTKFKDVKAALAAGYIPAPPGACVSAAAEGLPAQWGGMGIHYINPKLLKISQTSPRVDGGSTNTDFAKPSILLYEPQADGSLVLVGAENLVFLKAWKAAGNQAPPKFAGRVWDMVADKPDTPQDEGHGFAPHHDQHVYFRTMSSAGDQLKPFSPKVTCKNFKKSS